jgi:hypothetical protein
MSDAMNKTNQVSVIPCSTFRLLASSSNFDCFQPNADPRTKQKLWISAIMSWYLGHTVTTTAVWADKLLWTIEKHQVQCTPFKFCTIIQPHCSLKDLISVVANDEPERARALPSQTPLRSEPNSSPVCFDLQQSTKHTN